MNLLDRLAPVQMVVDRPSRMIVRGLDGKPLKAADGSLTFFDVLSVDSEAARKHERAVADDRLAQRGRPTVTASELDTEAVDLLAALTVGWGVRVPSADDGGRFEDTAATDFTAAMVKKLYADPVNADIARQVGEFARSKINFAKASPKG